MLNFNRDGLQIFDNFEVDENLPKHNHNKKYNIEMSNGGVLPSTSGFNFNNNTWQIDSGLDTSLKFVTLEKDSFKEWIGRKLMRISDKLTGRGKVKTSNSNLTNAPTLTIEEFFKSIKNSKRQMEKIDDRIESYEAAIQQAIDFGQVALKQELERKIEVVRSESQLYANNMIKVVLEQQIVQFYKESERGVRLDWIKNFSRTIPEKFIDVKKKLDELRVFDNYVIMHYDPDSKSHKMTDEEVEKAKDPILFGVISNSRKLYYIGDWVDEYCDLTMEDLIDKFGKEAIKKNNISANIDISIEH